MAYVNVECVTEPETQQNEYGKENDIPDKEESPSVQDALEEILAAVPSMLDPLVIPVLQETSAVASPMLSSYAETLTLPVFDPQASNNT